MIRFNYMHVKTSLCITDLHKLVYVHFSDMGMITLGMCIVYHRHHDGTAQSRPDESSYSRSARLACFMRLYYA